MQRWFMRILTLMGIMVMAIFRLKKTHGRGDPADVVFLVLEFLVGELDEFVLLILIALGVLGYLFRQQLLTVFNNLKEKITAPKEAVVTEEPETVAEDTIAYDETVAEDTVSEPEVYTPEVVRNTANGNYPVIRFEQGHYYVIAGSLPSEQDAVRHIKQRNLDQYEPKLVTQSGVSNLRVCIGIFDTEEEAESFAKNVNPKYWVLK